ncbi:MAG: aldehyde ferredoxin oxidoreductase family protein [Bacillota bacterium]|nr:aldehyde ferredoxin oxidoreductase family protein [Bacillota bacterium]
MFKGGYLGRVLRVNLTEQTATVEPLPESAARAFLGGRGLGAWYYRREIGPQVDPLSPENKLCFFTGPLTGLPLPATTKFGCATKSAETGHYLCSNSSGNFGPQLKFAGYDGLIIEGRADRPVYLWVNDGETVFRPAEDLWLKEVSPATEMIRAATGGNRTSVMAVGPAAVRGARIGCLMVDGRSFGRGGPGTVMAAKNLKAVAVLGTGKIPVAEPERLAERGREAMKIARETRQDHSKYGTNQYTIRMNALGCYPTRNFQTAVFPGVETIAARYVYNHYRVRNKPCFACPVGCAQVCEVKEGPFAGAVSDPEYETIGAFGGQCGVSDFAAIIAANQLCDEYGIDTMSTGTIIAYAMECFERNLFTREDTGGIELRFGDGEAMVAMVRQMGEGRGLGRELSLGFRHLAEKFPETVPYMMQCKGLPFAAYEPRGFHGIGLAYGTSSRGACHNVGGWTIRDELLSGKYDRFAVEGKGVLVKTIQDTRAYVDSLGICTVVRSALGYTDEPHGDVLELATGLDLTPELMTIGERIYTVERLITVGEGLTRADDYLPDRIMREALPEGPAAGKVLTREMYDAMLDEYYAARGWDREGVPTWETRQRLGLD